MQHFSVIVVTYNRQPLLRGCLEAVSRLDYPEYEIVVVDDGSTDGTAAMVQNEFPHVRCVVHAANQGEPAARNTGVRAATGEIIAFTDDDCVPARDWLQRHAAYYGDARIAAVGGPLVSPAPNFYDHFARAWYAPVYDPNPTIERITDYQHIGTGNMSVRRVVLDRIGPFDEAFRTGCDTDFVRRLSSAGHPFVRDPTLRVDHLKVYDLRSFLHMRFHRGCGSVLTDVREATLQLQRFVPIPNPVRAWQGWRRLRQAHGGGPVMGVRYWSLVVAARVADTAGRLYYYWTRGRHYRPPTPAGR